MKYMGSKARIAKDILPIILKDRKPEQWYVEPFVGGANTIDKVDGNRIGNDINHYLIALYLELQKGWQPPKDVTFEMYKDVKDNKSKYPDYMVGYIGLAFTFGATFFGGFVGSVNDVCCVGRDRIGESYRNVIKTQKAINGIRFTSGEYWKMQIPPESIIYCDPPYENTSGYKTGKFDHSLFWDWCRNMSKLGHNIYISEYNAPDDFECVWSKQIASVLDKKGTNKKPIEKLFTLMVLQKPKCGGIF